MTFQILAEIDGRDTEVVITVDKETTINRGSAHRLLAALYPNARNIEVLKAEKLET